MANIFSKSYALLDAFLDSQIQGLQKTEPGAELLIKGEKQDGTVGRKGLLFDPFVDQSNQQGIYKLRTSFLSSALLKQVARRDSVIAAILDTRGNQVATFCKRPANRFDAGFKLVPKDKTMKADADEIRKAEEFILNTGRTGDERKQEDRMTFDQWGYIVAQDYLRYGHAAVERVKRADGDLFSFLPLAAETIYYANKRATKETMDHFREIWQNASGSDKGDKEVKADHTDADYEFVQVINGQVTEGFTKDDLVFSRYNLQSDIDLNGYSMSILEKCVGAVTAHMQVENHQKQFFTHGTASKGLLWIAGDVSPNTLKALQAQWNNQITGPLNAWRTPILAGVNNVQWVPLTASNRDMEYAAWQDYVLRVIFGSFQIDPEEVGFGYLSKGTEQRSLGESSNEWKITASRDRGLRPLLGRIEAMINEEILPSYSKAFSEKYHFVFVGLDAETQQEELQRMQAETALHKTIDEARKEAEMEPLQYGGNMVLNPLLLQYLSMNLPKGVFMETFVGVQGASERPDLQYIPDPMWFQFQQMQMQMMGAMQPGAPGQGAPNGGQEDQAGAGADQGADGSDQLSPEDQQKQAEMQQQQMEAIQQYMDANPELFKSLKANLKKSEDLRKGEAAKRHVSTEHVDKMTEALVSDMQKGAEKLISEILKEVKADVEENLKGK